MTQPAPDVLVLGEALVDLVQQDDGRFMAVSGGGGANTAVALGRRGVDVAFLGRIGGDSFAERLRIHLESSKVDVAASAAVRESTVLSLATIDANSDATYAFYVDALGSHEMSIVDVANVTPPTKMLVLSGTVALGSAKTADAVDALLGSLKPDVGILFDPNVRPQAIAGVEAARERFDRWIRWASLVKASAEDVAWRWPGLTVEAAADMLIEHGAPTAFVTEGALGSHARTAEEAAWCLANKVEVVDTIGAGDTFSAGVVEWLVKNHRTAPEDIAHLRTSDLTFALEHASALAGETCKRAGADPPWLAELD